MATICSPSVVVRTGVTEGGGVVCASRVLDQSGNTCRVFPSAGLCARSSSSATSAPRSCSFTAVVGAGTRRILSNSNKQRHQQNRRALQREPAAVVVVCNAAEVKERPRRPKYIPNRIDDPNYVRIFDTTLRDGEQSPGASLTSKEKLDIARQLAKLGVDIIEAGYPRSSLDDLEAVKIIAKEVGNAIDDDGYVPVICGLSRCNKTDIDYAWEGVKQALRPRIHTFIATSELHMKHKLCKTPDEVVQIARDSVAYARSLGCDDVEFSPEDAGRSVVLFKLQGIALPMHGVWAVMMWSSALKMLEGQIQNFCTRILSEVIKAGATTLNIPDTVGITLPTEFGGLIAKLKANTTGAENVIFSTHCQNDLGLSTANSLAGAYAGARQVECTINGIGERAGNASLEEVVMAIKCRGEELLGSLYTGIDSKHITIASRMVADLTGMVVQPHKAIVGANAFAHESGIHQDGMLKHKGTYEIIAPEEIGLLRADEAGLVLGKLSGRHALKSRLQQLGYELDGRNLDEIFKRFKSLADKKKTVHDDDLEALLSDQIHQPTVIWSLADLQVVCGTMGLSTATVKLVGPDGVQQVGTSFGTGPVDASYKAVDMIVKEQVTLLEYSMTAVTEGIDAIAHTRVVIRGDYPHSVTHPQTGKLVQRSCSGTGAGEDVVVSSVRAYVSALNKLLGFSRSPKPSVREEESQVAA